MRRLLPIAAATWTALLGASCAGDAQQTEWALVGAYDATATLAAGTLPLAGYVWSPAPGMRDSCGPAKGPLGMGTFEAEAIGNGLTPVLALVLHYSGPGKPEPLTPSSLQLAVVDPDAMNDPDARRVLEPAVVPRRLALSVPRDADWEGGLATETQERLAQVRQLVWTQLSIELCLEHKVGRAWLGSEASQVREAFMLDQPRDADNNLLGEDRRFFVGQKSPAPALLGPPDACAAVDAGEVRADTDGLSGAGAPKMVASDIWGASLRRCNSRNARKPALALQKPDQLALESSTPWGQLLWEPTAPRHLVVDVKRNDQGQETFDLLDGDRLQSGEGDPSILGAPRLLFPKAPEDPTSTDLTDVLALIPHRYPLVQDGYDPIRASSDTPGTDWYTVLLIPDWQLTQAITQLKQAPWPPRGNGPSSGVTWILDHPDHLSVQVAPQAEHISADLAAVPNQQPAEWPDLLATAIGREWRAFRDWGYTVGLLQGRKPVMLPAQARPSWEVAQLAQRANLQGGFLIGLAGFLLVVGAGSRRLRDLWTPIPKERADYWPGVGVDENLPQAGTDSPSSTIPTE